MKKLVVFILMITGLLSEADAQDPFFTQFYNQPVYLNPALTGNTRNWRVSSTHRRQWMESIQDVSMGVYNTSAVSVDKFTPKGIGLGFTAVYDQISFYGFRNTRVNFSAAYELVVKRKIDNNSKKNSGWRLRFGMDAGLRELRLAGGRDLLFEDQILLGYTNEQFGANALATGLVPDFSFGLVSLHHFDYFLGEKPLKLWAGVAAHNFNAFNNTQNEALLTGSSIFPTRLTIHGGIEIGGSRFKDAQTQVKGSAFRTEWVYRHQGIQSQLDAGVTYSTANLGFYDYGSKNRKQRKYYSLLFGMRWRGITFEDSGNFTNDINSFAIVAGVNFADEMLVEFSYDIPSWQLGYSELGGTMEVSLKFHFGHGSTHNDLPQEKYRWSERRKFPLMNLN